MTWLGAVYGAFIAWGAGLVVLKCIEVRPHRPDIGWKAIAPWVLLAANGFASVRRPGPPLERYGLTVALALIILATAVGLYRSVQAERLAVVNRPTA